MLLPPFSLSDEMDPSQILFDAIANMTGGLITDIQTAMVALLSLSMICMGLDLLKDKLLLPYLDDLQRRGFRRRVRIGELELEESGEPGRRTVVEPWEYDVEQIGELELEESDEPGRRTVVEPWEYDVEEIGPLSLERDEDD